MIFELLHAPYEDGYGDALLPLEECKAHLRVTSGDEDDLIAILRDAAIEFVERYCSVRLRLTEGLQWRAEGFPLASPLPLVLGVGPVAEVTAVRWLDRGGVAINGAPADLRVVARRDLLPIVGGAWPSGVGGGVEIEFSAGYPEGGAPRTLLHAAKMFLAHLWLHREAVVDSGASGEVPFGVRQLCAPFRRVMI